MIGALTDKVKILKIKDHSAAGTSTITSDAIDTSGYGGVLLLTSFGTAAADNYIKAQQSDDDAATDAYSDLLGTQVITGASPSNEDVWIDIKKPLKRYIKLIGVPTTSSTIESMWAFLYDPVNVPVDNTTSGTIEGEAFVSPAEGTA